MPYVESDEESRDEEEGQEADPTKEDVIRDNRELEEMQINFTYIYNYLIEQRWTKNAIC